MSIKFNCKCGIAVIALTKKPGETMICNKCGAELVIPEESLHITGAVRKIKTATGELAEVSTESPSAPPSSSEIKDTSKLQELPSPEELKTVDSNQLSAPSHLVTPPPTIQELLPNKSPTTPVRNKKKSAPANKGKKKKSNAPIKCPKCGNISKPGAVLCIECGTSLRTGLKHVPAPAPTATITTTKTKAKINLLVIAIVAISLIILILTAVFIPKILENPKEIISKFFKNSEEGAEKIEEISE